jgi:hypothetical protein
MTQNFDSCCGQQRNALRSASAGETASSFPFATPANTYVPAEFEYTGATALTVIGPLTGRRYRFARTGARATVDGRDAYGLATVPVLRRMRE